MNYTLANLRPSEIEWLEEYVIADTVRVEFLDQLEKWLSRRDCVDTATLDNVYCAGAQLRKCMVIVPREELSKIETLTTPSAQVFWQGVRGQPFSPNV